MVVDKCRYCPVGQYQNATGQNACVPCPSNQATWTVGSRDSTECFVPPPSPLQEDTAWILIVAVAGGAGFLVMVMTLCVARYLYVSGRDRKRYDLEVDEISLYTDFPDLSYNTFFKRRQVVGFDSDGFPVVKNFRSHNGDVKHSIDAQEDSEDEESVSSELQMSTTRDHLAYPEPEGSETPFSYDPCRAAWNDNYVIPYEYPVMEQWDFPKIGHPMRYRIPGRTHLQNIYPLQQFGLMGEFCSRTRKEPPLPENLPVSNKLPQLMHRPEEKLSMKQIFKQAFGITSPHEEEHEQMIEINAKRALLGMPQMPPLPFKNKPSEPKFEHPPSKPLLDPKPFLWTRPARGQHVIDKGPDDYDRQEMALTKKILPAIRTASVLTPKSVNDLTNSPYRTTVRKSSDKPVINGATQSKRNNSSNQEYTKQIPHTKDPTSASTPIDAIILGRQSENVPSGRKSVTIHENFTPRKRPLTPLSIRRPSFSNSSASDISNTSTSNLPYSTNTKTSVDAVKTIPLRPVAYLPSDATDTYQPVSVTKRSLTPLNIPKPILHPEVAAKRTVPARPLAYLPSDAADTHQPMLAAGYTSQPMSVSADTSQPMSVSADTSQPMSVSADNSQPMPIVADSSQPMSVVADTYQSMSVVADTYQTMSVALSPVTEDTYQHISVTKRSLTPVEHPKPVLHPGVAVKRTVPARPLAYLPSDVVDTSRPMSIVAEKSQQKSVVSDIYEPMSFVPDTYLPMSIARLQVAADTYQPISVTKRSITPLEHPQPVLHPGVAVKRTAYHTPSTPNEPLKCIRPPSSFRYSLVPTPTFVNEQDFAARRRRDIESRVSYDMDGGIETLVGGQGFTMTSQPPESTAQPGRKGYLRP
ncbi:uncharacterized protein LOC127838319 [Dreissena polymorpha]|nr:uncharacterized protein LOC127838319 [Dreissena polymorpha]KAH3797033.1 hypothetical protein DPMN_150608 [Dreissena polymorpha]